VTGDEGLEELLRALAPQTLGALVRRFDDFTTAEDAVQEALITAAARWPEKGRPSDPLAWLIRVASRRLFDRYRGNEARRRRERLAASWSSAAPDEVSGHDDTLLLMFMCCHPSLTPAAAIPLTLRAVGGLTTREIATAFHLPEPTMAQRISRAKAKVRAAEEPLARPTPAQQTARLRSVLHVLYLVFNEGYASTSGPNLARVDLSREAIRLTRAVHQAVPDDPEVAGLLALMLLTDARRPARTDVDGALVPLDAQDRRRWDHHLVAEGTAILEKAVRRGQVGEYQVQAAIAAAHDRSPSHTETDWAEIVALYGLLERMTRNPVVRLNRAVAVAMANGPSSGLELLEGVRQELGDHHRFHAIRAHLLELDGQQQAAVTAYRLAASQATNLREREYLTVRAARLAAGSAQPT
jgi:RNA polymerase sigma factor (sigma-70 family)